MVSETIEGKKGNEYIFKGFNDTPFDEAIYSQNHLLWAPGGCKPNSDAGALCVVEEGVQLMSDEIRFSTLCPYNDIGCSMWCEHTLTYKESGSLTVQYMLSGWKPSQSYPQPRRWHAESLKRQHVDTVLEQYFVVVNEHSVAVYVEKRPTLKRSCFTQNNLSRMSSMMNNPMDGREVVGAQEMFRPEHEWALKHFRCFVQETGCSTFMVAKKNRVLVLVYFLVVSDALDVTQPIVLSDA